MNLALPDDAGDLRLDAESLDVDELSMPALTREINLQRRPNWLLVKMMNALEKKRQQKGLGWSRAWNKYGANTFRTHICDIENDRDYFEPIRDFLRTALPDLSEPYDAFVDDLTNDPKLMLFTFYHNIEDDGEQYEGLTLSLGRKREDDRTKRDRLDVVLEDRRTDGRVDARIDRVRVYVCPWSSYRDKAFHLETMRDPAGAWRDASQALYDHAIDYYHRWKGDDARQWSHWSARYIDYFGPRRFIPKGSSFT